MDVEALWYELFPYACGIGGVVAIVAPAGSSLLRASGVLLVVSAATILRARWRHRRDAFLRTPRAIEPVAQNRRDGGRAPTGATGGEKSDERGGAKGGARTG